MKPTISFKFPDGYDELVYNQRTRLAVVSNVLRFKLRQIPVYIRNRAIYGFINEYREFFIASELLPDWPTKRFRPCSLTDNMLENVTKRKLIKMQEAYAPLSRASYMVFYSVDDTVLPSSVGYSVTLCYF
ncbi:hypothetical protein AVEN_237229-1 [Araneus ventricosus]|uniref:Uncharacterized protein n=1 Tax=Araneus ventricosus TaxID=182803 RepID=A0A4Y2NX15_ARAVE|nr:hypothetical protein AVEN_237229-1 [Araneus ventricosus]